MRNIGRLDKRIEIETQSTVDSRDVFGAVEFTSNWSRQGYYYAEVKTLSGNEVNENGRQNGYARVEFTIRYLNNISIDNHRIKYDGRYFDIVNIRTLNSNRNDGLIITTEEVVGLEFEDHYYTPTGFQYLNPQGGLYVTP